MNNEKLAKDFRQIRVDDIKNYTLRNMARNTSEDDVEIYIGQLNEMITNKIKETTTEKGLLLANTSNKLNILIIGDCIVISDYDKDLIGLLNFMYKVKHDIRLFYYACNVNINFSFDEKVYGGRAVIVHF